MKQLIIIVLLGLLAGTSQAQAPSNFTETYKKAYAFTTTQPDSALHWAYKSSQLAQNSSQKYQAYYLMAYSAYVLCLPNLAIQGYKQALQVAPDSIKKYKVINNLSSSYLKVGDYHQASNLNKQSIAYFEKENDAYSLSYAYELEGAILQKQQNYGALDLFRKALKLRKQHANKKEVGGMYGNIADAFAQFTLYDSAVYYQQKAIKHCPIKSDDIVAKLYTSLAKYLLLADQTAEALPHLQTAKRLHKRPLTELLWCHTFAMYLSRLDNPHQTQRVFARCDSLLTRALVAAPDASTRKAISAQAVDMYTDALKLKALPDSTRLSYQAQLKLAQKHLKVANANLALKESHYSQALGKRALPLSGTSGQNMWWVAGWLVGIAGLVFGWRMRQHSKQVPEVTPPMPDKNLIEAQRLVQENKLIEEIVRRLGSNANKLNFHEREAIRQLYRGKSYNKIGDDIKEGGTALRVKFNRFAKDAGYNTMLELIKQISQDLTKND